AAVAVRDAGAVALVRAGVAVPLVVREVGATQIDAGEIALRAGSRRHVSVRGERDRTGAPGGENERQKSAQASHAPPWYLSRRRNSIPSGSRRSRGTGPRRCRADRTGKRKPPAPDSGRARSRPP